MQLKDYFDIDGLEEWVDETTDEQCDNKFNTDDGSVINLCLIEQYGGEGQGDNYWIVFTLDKNGKDKIAVRRNGWYASYAGHEWNDYEEVKPVQKVITVWESI